MAVKNFRTQVFKFLCLSSTWNGGKSLVVQNKVELIIHGFSFHLHVDGSRSIADEDESSCVFYEYGEPRVSHLLWEEHFNSYELSVSQVFYQFLYRPGVSARIYHAPSCHG